MIVHMIIGDNFGTVFDYKKIIKITTMSTDEIIEKLKSALEVFKESNSNMPSLTEEEYHEIYNFLEGQKMPEYGCHQWCRGKEPHWKVGQFLAYYELYSDYEGEQIIGEITKVELSESGVDWIYTFKSIDGEEEWYDEEQLIDDECYTISKSYYEKHC